MSLSRGVRLGILVVSCWAFTLQAAADPVPLAPGAWDTFSWEGLGPIDSPADGYHVTSMLPVHLRIADCCITGDAFDVFIDSVLAGSSPSVPGGIDTGATTPEAAWADPRLSRLLLTLPAGEHHIGISVRELATGFASGAAFIRADPVPEPTTLLLVGAGAAGLVTRQFRRRRPAGAR